MFGTLFWLAIAVFSSRSGALVFSPSSSLGTSTAAAIGEGTRLCSTGQSTTATSFDGAYREMLAAFSNVEPLTPVHVDPKYALARGVLGKKAEIEFRCEAFTSSRLRYVRMVSFAGQGYDVFNFLALPATHLVTASNSKPVDVPIFGADIVTLPGGVIAAIDLQPLSASPAYFQSDAYSLNAPTFKRWQSSFPPGGDLPEAAKQYFSPYALWTRFGPEGQGGSSTMDQIKLAMLDYCNAYTKLLQTTSTSAHPTIDSSQVVTEETPQDRELFLAHYLKYRIENDPAKRLLVGAFGSEWTEGVLRDVLFRGGQP